MYLNLISISGVQFRYDDYAVMDLFLRCKLSLEHCKNLDNAYKNNVLIDSVYSATIEGARTTVEEMCEAIHNPKTFSQKMVANAFKVQFQTYNGVCITQDNIRKLWEMLVSGVCENVAKQGTMYRSGDVYVGSATEVVHQPPEASKIDSFMNCLFAFMYNTNIDPIIRGIVVHFYFVYIHPFCDGNGRMARIMQNAIMYQNGYEGVSHISVCEAINTKLSGYYKALASCERLKMDRTLNIAYFDLTVFIKYMLNCILIACQKAEVKGYTLNNDELRLLTKMSKHGIGFNISVKAVAKILKCDNVEALGVLNKLVDVGYLMKGIDYLYYLTTYVK